MAPEATSTMILIKTKDDLKRLVEGWKANSKTIGFVPTMGALHAGHIALVEESERNCDVTVCSIFINPTQFNNANDLEKYPVTIERDLNMLELAGCDLVFLPSVNEMYPPGEKTKYYDLGFIETILEGKYRPGHFQGVCQVVDNY
jgi:pantoate--beta-alanine ligase